MSTGYHNPRCSSSRSTLALIREAGIEPAIVEYLNTPPDRATLADLIQRLRMTPRAPLREKEAAYTGLGLGSAHWSDAELIGHMLAHPILINRPIVVTGKGARLWRPPEKVLEILP